MRWTPHTLNKKLRELLASDRVEIVPAKLNAATHSAEAWWKVGDKRLYIAVDPVQEGWVKCVVHEMLHYVLRDDIKPRFNPVLEEVMIRALEEYFYKRIGGSTKRYRGQLSKNRGKEFEWWRLQVGEKLGEPDAE